KTPISILTFGLLKTSVGDTSFGTDEKTPTEITIKNNTNTIVIPSKNIFCLCFGDIKTTATFLGVRV
ncbi:MAG: hypothetical protein NT094_01390, partial [Candidatus Staskawiczbacteria bacterium]|nr:hypothetical protein [Candidatus Staskawiczbacteria bacterium]